MGYREMIVYAVTLEQFHDNSDLLGIFDSEDKVNAFIITYTSDPQNFDVTLYEERGKKPYWIQVTETILNEPL